MPQNELSPRETIHPHSQQENVQARLDIELSLEIK